MQNLKSKTPRNRIERQLPGAGEWGKRGLGQTSSYKTNTFWESNEQHGGYSL